ncbi:TPA: hypothetical protein RQK84_003282 [Vibrio vulnificus]|nr:hypothetical protein [Vibrio vulnificus]HDY8015193.1 hypothetical protein [Vibrio vulnificus]
MYNLSVDEISMVDGGGDGGSNGMRNYGNGNNPAGYPASQSAVNQQASSPNNGCVTAVTMGMVGGLIGAGAISIGAAMAASFGGAVAGSGSCK